MYHRELASESGAECARADCRRLIDDHRARRRQREQRRRLGGPFFVTTRGTVGDQPADSWDEKDKTVAFDGDWKKAKIAEAEYTKTYTDADERYAKMLSTLLAQAKGLKKAGS